MRNDYVDDPWAAKARQMGLRARSYFKLEELDRRFSLVKKGLRVIDLGAAPGSWAQYVLRKTAGLVDLTLIDLQEIHPFSEGKPVILRGDALDASVLPEGLFDLVLSDMAPNTSGNHLRDSSGSAELVRMTIRFARERLKPGGRLVAKYLQGSDQSDLQREFREQLGALKQCKPKACRKQSTEIFFVCEKTIPPAQAG